MQNPPWTTKILDANWDAISARATELGMSLPKFGSIDEKTSKFSFDELGCGHFGCVFSSSTPGWVFKITTDESEALFIKVAQKLAGQGVSPSGIVKYKDVFRLPGTYKGRPTFCLWREEASVIGFDTLKKHYCNDEYMCRQFNIMQKIVGRFKDVAYLVRERLIAKHKKDEAGYWPWLEAQVEGVNDVWDRADDVYEKWTELDKSYTVYTFPIKNAIKNDPRAVSILLRICERLTEEMANENVAYQVGRCMSDYLEAGVLMADLHMNNVGLVDRVDPQNDFAKDMPVVTDPGHVLILKKALSEVIIEPISAPVLASNPANPAETTWREKLARRYKLDLLEAEEKRNDKYETGKDYDRYDQEYLEEIEALKEAYESEISEESNPREYPLACRDSWYGECDYDKRGGRMVYMTPQEFLERVRPLKIDESSRDNIDDLKRHIQGGGTLDPLYIYANGKEDGRHRAHASIELGIKKVPVLVF